MTERIEYILFTGFGLLFKILGIQISRRAAFFIAVVFYYLIPIRKKTVIENLTKSFPEYSHKKIKKIAFGSYYSFAVTLVEILYLPNLTEEKLKKIVICQNEELILQKYNENNGVILLSAHFGNWEYVAAATALKIRIPFTVIVKLQSNPLVTEWLNKMRTKWGNRVVPLGISIRQIYKELKEKNIVAMVADQRGPADGIRVNFFGRKAAVYPGPALLALKTKAPILFGVGIRQPDFTYKLLLKEINIDDLYGSDEEKVIEISQRHTAFLEEVIRRHPEQWLWMHKRWKY